jgi:hypothetical protein
VREAEVGGRGAWNGSGLRESSPAVGHVGNLPRMIDRVALRRENSLAIAGFSCTSAGESDVPR